MKRIPRLCLWLFVLSYSTGISARQLFHRNINQWKNNRYEGLWISWYDTLGRQVERKGHYHDGNERGTWKYYENGKMRKVERYSRRGISTKYFYPNGKLKSKGKAVMDTEEQYLHYYYQGDWIYYGEDGKPEQVVTYERGKEIAHRKVRDPKEQE